MDAKDKLCKTVHEAKMLQLEESIKLLMVDKEREATRTNDHLTNIQTLENKIIELQEQLNRNKHDIDNREILLGNLETQVHDDLKVCSVPITSVANYFCYI